MTATTEPRFTPTLEKGFRPHPIKGSTKILQGTLCVLDAGFAKGGAAATGLFCIGKAVATYDNTDGTDGLDANGEPMIGLFEFGEFIWANGDSITQADVGKVAYVFDNQTCKKDSTSMSPAGEITGVDSRGVKVYTPDALAFMKSWGASTGATLSGSAPAAIGAAAAGSGTSVSKDDHVHAITCLPLNYEFPGDAAAEDEVVERVIHVQPAKAVTISAINIYPSANVTHDASNYCTIVVKQRTSGGSANTVATLATSSGDWTAFTAKSMGAITNAALAAGSQLTLEISKTGDGVALPQLMFEVVAST